MSESCDFHKKPLLIFELNEFNEDLLETAAKQHNLKNILALLNYPKTKVTPKAIPEGPITTPSERWESLHTGIQPAVHEITRLGPQYSPHRPLPFWEALLAHQYTIGLWGVMNAKKPKATQSKFFLPDLAQAKETAYPKSLTYFVTLPRYINKNFPSFSPDLLFSNLIKFVSFIKRSGIGKFFTLELIRLLFQLIRTTPRTLLFICFYDLISCMLFCAQLKKNPVNLSIFFANSLAYLQHYYWKQGKWVATAPLLHGLKIIDRMVGMLRQFESSHHLMLINGLSQENRQNQPEQLVYKIKVPTQFFGYMALSPMSVNPLSHHEGIVYFENAADCLQACDTLNKASLSGHAIFEAQKLDHCSHALHYTIVLSTPATKDDFFELSGTEFRLFKYFKPVYILTGSHHAEGVLFSQGVDFPKEILPESFSQYILNYYDPKYLTSAPNLKPAVKSKDV